MKIITKFIGSSVVVGAVVVSLITGSALWFRHTEQSLSLVRQNNKEILNLVLNLQITLGDQVVALKDFLLLERDPILMSKYHRAKSEFLLDIEKLEQLAKNVTQSSQLEDIKKRHKLLLNLVDQLSDQSQSRLQTQQDVKSINSYSKDIEFNIDLLITDLQKQNDAINQKVKNFQNSIIVIQYGTIVIIMLLFFAQFRYSLLPVINALTKLKDSASNLAEGNLDYRLTIKNGDEVEQLGNEFNRMAEKLSQAYQFLEDKVEERTAKIQETNDYLQIEMLERLKIEGELQKLLNESKRSQKLLQTVVNATPDWIFVKDRNFRFILVNQSFATAINSSPEIIIGKDDIELGFPPEQVFGNAEQGIKGFRSDDQAVLDGQMIHNTFDVATDAQGKEHILDTKKIPLYDEREQIFGLLGFAHDITEIKQAEIDLKNRTEHLEATLQELQETQTQLIQSEKMSSLGQLVAGIAHEINNPVNFIYGNIRHAEEYIDDLLALIKLYQNKYPQPDSEIREEIDNIDLEFLLEDLPKLLNSMKLGADRIRDIVLSLRTFSRLDEADMKAVNIHEGIDSTLMILQNRLKARPDHPEIKIIKQYGDLPLVECYAGQLNQVFMNILSNAIDALDDYNQERTLEEIKANPGQIVITTEIDSQQRLVVRIKDNGKGMTEDVRRKLFDPFFTTKAIGKGTGLGLSISHSIIVEKHQGTLECISEVGKGAEFIITI